MGMSHRIRAAKLSVLHMNAKTFRHLGYGKGRLQRVDVDTESHCA